MRNFSKAILVASAALCLNLSAFSQNVSFSVQNVTVKEAMEQLKKTSGYSFVFSSSDVDTSKKVSVSGQNSSIQDIIQQILQGQNGLDYEIQGKKIIVKRQLTGTSNSHNKKKVTVKGKVLDVNGEPIIGAAVKEVGTTNGTVTDFDGNFSFEADVQGTLEVSYVGYKIKKLKIEADQMLAVTMEEDAELLDEVVVIGYGTMKRSDLTGAVTSIKTADITATPTTNALKSLQGKVAGLDITQSSGQPGATASLTMRGNRSLNADNQPLVLVDGIDYGSFVDINPTDIESIEVLKDISSTAIYGTKGANGVILITTKSGAKGQKTRIDVNAYISIKNKAKYPRMMNGLEYAQLKREAYRTTNAANPDEYMDDALIFNAEELEYLEKGYWVDWQDLLLGTGITQNYKVAVSSGNDKTQFYLSGNYMGQTGVVIESKNERYQAKANVTSQVTPWLHVTADVNASHNIRKGGSFATGKDNPIWIAMNYSPTMQMMDGNNYAKDPINSIASNPVGILRLQGGETMTDVFTGHVDLRFNLAKGLTFTTTNGVDYYDAKSYSFSSKRVNPSNSMGNSDTYRMMLQSSNNFTYMGKWNKHSLTSTAVYEVTKYEERLMNISGKNLLTESVGWWDASMAQSRDVSNGIQNWALVSGVTRVMYNYNDRYQLTGTFRADGSSRFSKNKWGFFPSVAAAWTISNEKFMKNVKAVQDLKLRASFGIVGNQAIDPYSTLGLMTQTKYNFGTSSDYVGYWANDIATPELTWEKTRQFDVGLDFSMFNHRLSMSVDYFDKRTTDALLKKTMPNYKGGASYWVNDGEISNRGVDISLTAHLIQHKNFTWSTTVNRTYLKNRVEKLAGGENYYFFGSKPASGMVDEASIIKPGYAIGSFYGYIWTGLDESGKDTYQDMDNSGTIDGSDRRVIGKATPDFTVGWNNTLTYKNWDLNLFFNGAFGADRLNLARFTMASMVGDSRFITLREAYTDNFDKVGQSAIYPGLKVAGNNYQAVSTKWVEDASYVRLENISLSYNLSKKVTKFADIRLTLSCQNLFTITGYKGMDPVGTTFSNDNVDVDAGIDMGAYPTPRTFTFGVRMNF